jgi:shikimate kinase
MFRNICLIGLPSSGKTIIGKRLYKYLQMGFVDTDDMIRLKYKSDYHDEIKYREIEQDIITSLHLKNTIIATSSTVVYQPESMHHLRYNLASNIYHLYLPKDDFEERFQTPIDNLDEFYDERIALYNKYADKTISTHKSVILNTFRDTLHQPSYQDRYANRISFPGVSLQSYPSPPL